MNSYDCENDCSDSIESNGKFNSNILIDILNLGSLAFKTYESTMFRDITVLHNLYMFGECNDINSLLRSKSYGTPNGILSTIDTDWFNPFYKEDLVSPRDIVILIDSYTNASQSSSVTAESLCNMYLYCL